MKLKMPALKHLTIFAAVLAIATSVLSFMAGQIFLCVVFGFQAVVMVIETLFQHEKERRAGVQKS